MLTKMNQVCSYLLVSIFSIFMFSCGGNLIHQSNNVKEIVNTSDNKKIVDIFNDKEILSPNVKGNKFNEKLPIDDIFNSDWIRTKLDGNSALALAKAVSTFLETDKSQEISNFRVEFGEYKNLYIVSFIAKLAKGEREQLGGGTSLGRDAIFFIQKDNFAISGPHLQK